MLEIIGYRVRQHANGCVDLELVFADGLWNRSYAPGDALIGPHNLALPDEIAAAVSQDWTESAINNWRAAQSALALEH